MKGIYFDCLGFFPRQLSQGTTEGVARAIQRCVPSRWILLILPERRCRLVYSRLAGWSAARFAEDSRGRR